MGALEFFASAGGGRVVVHSASLGDCLLLLMNWLQNPFSLPFWVIIDNPRSRAKSTSKSTSKKSNLLNYAVNLWQPKNKVHLNSAG